MSTVADADKYRKALATYKGARAVRSSSGGSNPWELHAADGSNLSGWKIEGRFQGMEVHFWKLKRDAVASRDHTIAKIEERLSAL